MPLSRELITLGQYLAGEFENQQQAIASPIWYVHLRLWLRPVPLFREDSLTLYAEQASVVKLDQPYRPRLLRLCPSATNPQNLTVKYYMFKDIEAIVGAGRRPEMLQKLTPETVELLPECDLTVEVSKNSENNYRFRAFPANDKPCCFTYGGNNYQVWLGFEVDRQELLTYDKGIDPATGKAIWGALMGPYTFTKSQDFAAEFS